MLPENISVLLGSKEFHFSMATTAKDLMQGLKGVMNLEFCDGMLFDFGCPFSPIMTPKGLEIPVDLAFITEAGEVVEIHKLDPEYGFNQGTERQDVRYALEAPVGFFDLHGIKIGDLLLINR